MTRRGFALAELVVALVIAGIIGVALARLVINQARFISVQDGMMRARSGSRAAFNLMSSELRMVGDSGLRAAGADSVMVRVPYVFGVACGYSAGRTVVGLIPADSAMVSSATARGMAYRDTLGTWHFVEPTTVTAGASTATCWGASPSIQVLTTPDWSGRAVYASGTAAAIGSPVYFYQTVTYSFANSVDIPGRRALWRAVPAQSIREELVVPFDTSARFEFLVGNVTTVQTTPPASLDSVMGVRVRLIGASEQTPAGRTMPMTFSLITNLYFRNRVH